MIKAKSSGQRQIVSIFLVLTGTFLLSFFISFCFANFHHELSGGSWFDVEDLIMLAGLICSGAMLIAGVFFLIQTKSSFTKTFVCALAAGACFVAGQVFFHTFSQTVYLNPKSVAIQSAKKSQEHFFSKASLDTKWMAEKIPLYFAREQELRRINVDGSEENVIFSGNGKIVDFVISPDSNYILIRTGSSPDADRLYLLSLNDGISTPVGDIVNENIQWSWNGKRFLYNSNGLGIIDVESKNVILSPKNNTLRETPFIWAKNDNAINFYRWEGNNGLRYLAQYKISLPELTTKSTGQVSSDGYITYRWNQNDSTGKRGHAFQEERKGYIYGNGGVIEDIYCVDKYGRRQNIFSAFVLRNTVLNLRAAVTAEGECFAIMKPDHAEEGLFIYRSSSGNIGKLLNYPDISMFAFYKKDE